MATRDELLEALVVRYREAQRAEKGRILTEFAEVTGYHRKHAERLLRGAGRSDRSRARPERRLYDDAVREALIVLWEASDRICGKRLKPLLPMLIGSMERHGHLALDAWVRARLEAISPATIDRILAPVRAHVSGRRRRTGSSPAIRRSVPIRSHADWGDPPPGFVEADLVAHSGPSTSGSFVQTLVLTDVASGWTACAPLIFREQQLLGEVMTVMRDITPVPDTLGLMLRAVVHPASVQDRDGATRLLNRRTRRRFPIIEVVFADQGYQGPKAASAVARAGSWTLEIVRRASGERGFAILPKRWIVERTLSWIRRKRRLVRDFEHLARTAEAMIALALIKIMLRRLCR